MKHLMTFENFIADNEVSYAVGDLVFVIYGGEQRLAKITKVNAKNSYIVNLEEYNKFLPTPINIGYNEIVSKAKGIDEPALNNDLVTRSTTQVSNDLVINNYPKTI